MTVLFRRLHYFVSVSISPSQLVKLDLTDADFERWDKFMQDCARDLKLLLSDQMMGLLDLNSKKEWMLSCQRHLTDLINEVNAYIFRQDKLWEISSRSKLIRSHYLKSIDGLQHLLDHCVLNYSAYFDFTHPFSRHKLAAVRPVFRSKIAEMRRLLGKSDVDQVLVDLVLKAARTVKRSTTFSPFDWSYYWKLFEGLEKLEELNQRSVVELLVRHDFNKPAFLGYLMDSWTDMLSGLEGLHEQLAMIGDKKKELQGQMLSGEKAYEYLPSIKSDLLAYCREHKEYFQEMLELRRMFNQDELNMKEASRILCGFSVPQIALFFKLQVEKGWIQPMSLASLYRFISRNFYTEKAPMISEHSLKREYEDVKFKTAYKMYLALLEFIEWLDEHFQVKSYKPV